MTRHEPELQAQERGVTAPEATKRGYGLWRGEVIHPATPRMNEIIASGDPITDTKGLGLIYVPVRGEKVIPHFRVHDPEKFSAALDRMFPAVHDAVVTLVAEDIRVGGYDALAHWCAGTVLPEQFKVADVVVEKRCSEGGVSYRPDISVLHSEGGRIELEVVNTHAPESGRLDAAWDAGHLAMSLRIRDLVEQIVFSEGRGAVPEKDALREMLRGRRFRLCGRERVPEAVQVVWRDLNLSAYAMELRAKLREMYWGDVRAVQNLLSEVLNSIPDGDLDPRVKSHRAWAQFRRNFELVRGGSTRADDLTHLEWDIAVISRPWPPFAEVSAQAEAFLDHFSNAGCEPKGVRKLRYTVAAAWWLRKRRLETDAHNASLLLNLSARNGGNSPRRPLVATEQGIS